MSSSETAQSKRQLFVAVLIGASMLLPLGYQLYAIAAILAGWEPGAIL